MKITRIEGACDECGHGYSYIEGFGVATCFNCEQELPSNDEQRMDVLRGSIPHTS